MRDHSPIGTFKSCLQIYFLLLSSSSSRKAQQSLLKRKHWFKVNHDSTFILTIQVHSQEHHTAWSVHCRPDQVHTLVLWERFRSNKRRTWRSRWGQRTWGEGRTVQTHQLGRWMDTEIRQQSQELLKQKLEFHYYYSVNLTISLGLAFASVSGFWPVADSAVLVKPESG